MKADINYDRLSFGPTLHHSLELKYRQQSILG
jgi:hypothetical protein